MTKGIRFKAKCLWEMIWLFRVISNLMLSKSEHFQIVTITYLQMLQKIYLCDEIQVWKNIKANWRNKQIREELRQEMFHFLTSYILSAFWEKSEQLEK